jgi:hypothetical protein
MALKAPLPTGTVALLLPISKAARSIGKSGVKQCLERCGESGTAVVLGNMAEMEFGDGHPERALRAINEALEIHAREPGVATALQQRETTEQWGYDKLLTALQETLSADEIAQLAASGATWSEDPAVEEALLARSRKC